MREIIFFNWNKFHGRYINDIFLHAFNGIFNCPYNLILPAEGKGLTRGRAAAKGGKRGGRSRAVPHAYGVFIKSYDF